MDDTPSGPWKSGITPSAPTVIVDTGVPGAVASRRSVCWVPPVLADQYVSVDPAGNFMTLLEPPTVATEKMKSGTEPP